QGHEAPCSFVEVAHDSPPSPPATKSATRSGPRPAGGMWIISERSTTAAAATPNTNWETMNQAQSTRSCSTGLTTPMSPYVTPVHTSGRIRPPQAIGPGRGGSRGVTRANRTPKQIDRTAWRALAAQNQSAWKLPRSAPSRLPRPGRIIPASRLTGYQKPRPLTAAHRTAGRAMAAPPTTPPTTPATDLGRRLAPSTTAGMVMPKTNCESRNHGQLTFPGNDGLTTCIAT